MFAAATYLTTDSAWPWPVPGTFVAVAILLVGLTVWTYLGRASRRKLAIVLALRLIALIVTLLLILRPSIAHEDEDTIDPTKIIVVIDGSISMNQSDEFAGRGRFEHAQSVLAAASVQERLRRLADEKKVEVIYYKAAETLERYDPATKAVGKLTDIHRWLEDLLREHGRDASIQCALLFSDGIDTGDMDRTRQKAREFKFPIHAFGVGQSNAAAQDKDIALEKIFVAPEPLLAKGKMSVKVVVRAPGFENAQTDFTLWIEDRKTKEMKQVVKRFVRLPLAFDNEVTLEADAPDTEGEIKITVKAEPLKGEVTVLNNEISTYAYVSKEGIRILWVDGKLRFESTLAIRESLRKDRRFQVEHEYRPIGSNRPGAVAELGKRSYDVMVISEISAARLSGGDLKALFKIRELVQDQGMGLLMLGGNDTFGNSDWHTSPLADLFPVRFDRPGQIEGKVKLAPTPAGLSYLLKLADDEKQNQELWTSKFEPLEGLTIPGTVDPRATVFATRDGDPETAILAGIERGKGRILTFAGDTTHLAWRRNDAARAGYDRFWKQMILLLAHREMSQGNVFVALDQRRYDRGRTPNLGYRVGFRGVEVKDATFTAKVIGPTKREIVLPLGADQRGVWPIPAPGEYTVVVKGKGTTSAGQPISGTDEARFFVTEEDRESLRLAADHDFLKDLAKETHGGFARAEERTVNQLLDELQAAKAPATTRVRVWPDWKRPPASDSIGSQLSTLWQSTALACVAVYVFVLCLEWFLRRRWGMV